MFPGLGGSCGYCQQSAGYGRAVPAEGKASLEVVCEHSLQWVISWCKWPHPLWGLLALLPASLCCGHTSLPGLLEVKTSSWPFWQENAFGRDMVGQDPWEVQCIQALSGCVEPQEWCRAGLCRL